MDYGLAGPSFRYSSDLVSTYEDMFCFEAGIYLQVWKQLSHGYHKYPLRNLDN